MPVLIEGQTFKINTIIRCPTMFLRYSVIGKIYILQNNLMSSLVFFKILYLIQEVKSLSKSENTSLSGHIPS
jgi:hypothetical protein